MLKSWCGAAIAIFCISPAIASNYCDTLHECTIPARFLSGGFVAQPVIKDLPFRQVQTACGGDAQAVGTINGILGCAVLEAGTCSVYLSEEFKTRLPAFYAKMREHELAHCRGWRH